jgi:hypothetical protein
MQPVHITTDVVSSNLNQGKVTRCTTLYDKVCQWLATDQWFSPGSPVSSTNKTDHHDKIEILLKVALNAIKQTNIKSSLPGDPLVCYYCWCSILTCDLLNINEREI